MAKLRSDSAKHGYSISITGQIAKMLIAEEKLDKKLDNEEKERGEK